MSRYARVVARAAIAFGLAAALGACASIPKRAWANGEGMTMSRGYRAVMSGDMSMRAHRALQTSLNPRYGNFRHLTYPAFGQWW
jgi:hypothetical protein